MVLQYDFFIASKLATVQTKPLIIAFVTNLFSVEKIVALMSMNRFATSFSSFQTI